MSQNACMYCGQYRCSCQANAIRTDTPPQPKGDALHALIEKWRDYANSSQILAQECDRTRRYVEAKVYLKSQLHLNKCAKELEAALPEHDAAIRSEALAMAAECMKEALEAADAAKHNRGDEWDEIARHLLIRLLFELQTKILSLAPNPQWLDEHDAALLEPLKKLTVNWRKLCTLYREQISRDKTGDEVRSEVYATVAESLETIISVCQTYPSNALAIRDKRTREEYEETIPHGAECLSRFCGNCSCGKAQRVARLKL